MKIFQIVKKTTVVVMTDVVNFVLRKTVGIRLGSRLKIVKRQAVGLVLSVVGRLLVTNQKVGLSVGASVEGETQNTDDAGISISNRSSGVADRSAVGKGVSIVRASYTLEHLSGATSAANDGPQNWTNPGNATGSPDGSNATRAGQVLNSTDANLRLGYNALVGKGQLTVDSVSLHFHVAQSGTTLNNGGLSLQFRLDPVMPWQTFETITGNVNNLTNPRTHQIDPVFWTWGDLQNVEVRVRAVLGAATSGVTCSVDAVTLEVNATRTDNL